MLYSQQHFGGPHPVRVRHCITLEEHIEHTVPVSRTPFLPGGRLARIKKRLLLKLAWWCQRFFRIKLYSENQNTLLFQLDPEARSLLSWLIRQQLLESWWFVASVPGYPLTKVLVLKPNIIIDPQGRRYYLGGANGVGTGESYRQAALPALGEFIERLASAGYWWEHPKIFRSVYKKQAGSTMIEPRSLMYLDTEHIQDDVHAERFVGNFDATTLPIHWCPGVEFVSNKRVYLPASACYMFAQHAMLDDPYFPEVSSNGVATHTNYYEACTRALLEYVERDHLMRAWYHQRPGTIISLESLKERFADARRICEAHTHLNESYVIDITDDLQIPTIVGIRIDRHEGSRAVHFTASADLDYDEAVKKCLKELIRFASSNYHLDIDNPAPESIPDMYKRANSITGRGQLWSHQVMVNHLQWFIQGDQVNYDIIKNQKQMTNVAVTAYKERYELLRDICSRNDITVYFVDMTNKICNYAGLRVVRALSPSLVSVFFDERYMPVHHPRLVNQEHTKDDLYQIPHPFL